MATFYENQNRGMHVTQQRRPLSLNLHIPQRQPICIAPVRNMTKRTLQPKRILQLPQISWKYLEDYAICHSKPIVLGQLYTAYKSFDHKQYVAKFISKKECAKAISIYKEVGSYKGLPRLKAVLNEENQVCLILDLSPIYESLQSYAEVNKVIHYANEIISIVHNLHESGLSPQGMTQEDFVIYKDLYANVGYHLQINNLHGALRISDFDEELPLMDSLSPPEVVRLLTSKKEDRDETEIPSAKRTKFTFKRNDHIDLELGDSWRVGCILYKLLTGRLPFPDPQLNQHEFFKAVNTTQIKIPSKITKNAWDFLLGLLEPDPLLRMSISDALEHPWMQEFAMFSESNGIVTNKEDHKIPLFDSTITPSSPHC